jgi:hypothetical protein
MSTEDVFKSDVPETAVAVWAGSLRKYLTLNCVAIHLFLPNREKTGGTLEIPRGYGPAMKIK